MKFRLILLASLSLLCSQLTLAQIPFYDAYKLKADTQVLRQTAQRPGKPDTTITTYRFKDSTALKILQPYTDSAGTGKPFNKLEAISNAFTPNPFINPFLNKAGIKLSASFLSSAISSIGNANVTSVADGLAKLIVSRVKADANVYFFQKLQIFLNQKCPELKVLFPNTSLLMNHFAAIDYSNILNTLREAFDKDLYSMLANIPNLDTLSQNKYSAAANARITSLQNNFLNKNDGIIFLSATVIGNGLLTGQKFPDILYKVVNNHFLKWTDSADSSKQLLIRSTADLVSILSTSVRSNQTKANYVGIDSLKLLLNDSMARTFYLGLIWQQLYNHHDTIAGKSLAKLIENVNFDNKVITYIDSVMRNGASVTTAFNNLAAARKKGESDLSSYYSDIFDSASHLLTVIQNIKVINDTFSFPETINSAFSYGIDVTNITSDLLVKNYNAALIGLQKFASDIETQNPNATLDSALQHLIKYASFAANVVTAKSSDDVENAIEAIVLPAENAVTQRNTKFSISINAYGGLFAGNEWMPTLKTKATAFSAGVTAPVGFAFTWGNIGHGASAKTANGKSITLFVPLIDLGALAAFRFQNDSANISSNVQLKNILAPGLFVYFGFGKCPISLGFGAQLGPQLRDVTATDVNVNKNYYIRYGFNLLVDIPLFNLFTNTK